MTHSLERFKYPLLAVVICCGALFGYFFGSYAWEINRQPGFPLDDPWIHLQFAKNLQEYGSFSYFKNEMVTAGSTSPLYTLLLAVGFFFTSNEMMLSYSLGTCSLLLAAFFFFKLIESYRLSTAPFFALGALLLLLEPRMIWAALSGMETTLFISLVLASLYYYQDRKPVPFGIASGLLLWTRPEAVILFIAIALDVVYHHFWVKTKSVKKRKTDTSDKSAFAWIRTALIVLALFAVAYIGFNFHLSGSILPNTYAAKLKYYGGGVRQNFPLDLFHYLSDGHMIVAAILAALGIWAVLLRILRRQPQAIFVPLGFSVGMFLAYWMKLPYLYQEGRYMMPVIPLVLLLSLSGIEWITSHLKMKERTITVAANLIVLLIAAQFAFASLDRRTAYAEVCKYISDRQVRTAQWLNENTPADAIIGTHDIGAIAFYSGRKIADMVGLVSPEAVEGIGSLNKLYRFLVDKKVTHLALLRNWFEVVNQNPVFKTDERRPEIMEVFEFDPQQTHITPQNISAGLTAASRALYQGQFDVSERILRQAIAKDPRNSKLHHLLATVFLATNRVDEANHAFTEALRLHPKSLDSQIGLAHVAVRQGRRDEGMAILERIAEQNPGYPTVFRALADFYSPDSDEAKKYMAKFEDLMREDDDEN